MSKNHNKYRNESKVETLEFKTPIVSNIETTPDSEVVENDVKNLVVTTIEDISIIGIENSDEITTEVETNQETDIVDNVVEEPPSTTEETTNVIIDKADVTTQRLSFYKVGIDMINDKCVNQVVATTDLTKAKEECELARNKYLKTYHVFDRFGNAVYTMEYTMPKDKYYRVGTEWKNGVCINQKFTSSNRNEAEVHANQNTRLTGVIHHVFDPSGKVIFSAKKKLTLLTNKKKRC